VQLDLKNPEVRGLADQLLSTATVGINFSLKTLITRAADDLDVGQSRIRLEFRRGKDDSWGWTARLRDERGKTIDTGSNPAPIEALALLIERVKADREAR